MSFVIFSQRRSYMHTLTFQGKHTFQNACCALVEKQMALLEMQQHNQTAEPSMMVDDGESESAPKGPRHGASPRTETLRQSKKSINVSPGNHKFSYHNTSTEQILFGLIMSYFQFSYRLRKIVERCEFLKMFFLNNESMSTKNPCHFEK